MRWQTKYAALSSAELFEASGVSLELQRLWRRRGYISAIKGTRAEYDPFRAGEIALLHNLTRVGLPPSEGASPAKRYGNLVLFGALLDAPGSLEVIGPRLLVDRLVEEYESDTRIAAQVARTNMAVLPPYLTMLDGKPPVLMAELPDIEGHHLATTISAVNVLSLARTFAARYRLPLARLELAPDQGDERGPQVRVLLPRKGPKESLRA